MAPIHLCLLVSLAEYDDENREGFKTPAKCITVYPFLCYHLQQRRGGFDISFRSIVICAKTYLRNHKIRILPSITVLWSRTVDGWRFPSLGQL